MRVLVTGIAGFIGSHVGERLLARGDQVVGLDNFDPFYDRSCKDENLAALRAADGFELVDGTILDAELLDRVVGTGFDAIVHLAALAGVRPSIAKPWRYQEVNVVGTSRVAEAAVTHGVGRLVSASSSSVYGDNTDVPYSEDQRVDQQTSPYASSKRSAELLLRTLSKIHGLDTCSLRFFTVYGPRQRPEMAIHKFCRLVEAGEPITVFGDGSSSRDYTYIDDIVDGTVGALDRAPAGCHIYNLGNTHPIKLSDLVVHIGKALGKEPIVEHAPMQPGDVLQTWANVDAARRDFGYEPKVSIELGLARFAEWMRSRRSDGH